MSGHLEYTKKFIILKNDFCNIPGKKPKGHVKIEIRGLKGSLSLSVENAEANQNYDVVLIAGNKTYSPGKIYTEKTARGREDIAFNISDLEANGIRINSLSGLVLAREENVLLGGYMGREDKSIERYIKNLEDNLLANKASDEPEPVVLSEKPEIIISEDRLVGERDQDIIDDSEEEVEFVVSKELEEDKESLVNEEILKDIDDDIKEEVLEVKEVPGLEISEEDFVEEEEISLDDISDEEKLIKEEEIIKNLDDEIFHEETLDDEQIRLDDSPDRCGFIVEEVDDNIDLDKEAEFDEKSHVKVEFIEPEEFQIEVDLEADEKFFEPLEDFKEVDDRNAESEFIENDVQMDDDDDIKTYIKASLDLDKVIDDEETYPCNQCASKDCEDIAAINLDRVITDEPRIPFGNGLDKYDDVEFSEDDILFEVDEPFETKGTIPAVSIYEEFLELDESQEEVSLEDEMADDEVDIEKEVDIEEEIDHDPLLEEIINDVKLEDSQEDNFNLEDYDKKIIEQYESVFENKPVESNEEVTNSYKKSINTIKAL